jgi:hypothetical protein
LKSEKTKNSLQSLKSARNVADNEQYKVLYDDLTWIWVGLPNETTAIFYRRVDVALDGWLLLQPWSGFGCLRSLRRRSRSRMFDDETV